MIVVGKTPIQTFLDAMPSTRPVSPVRAMGCSALGNTGGTVVDGLGGLVLRGEFCALRAQPGLQLGD